VAQLSMSKQVKKFEGGTAVFAQVGWLGQTGQVYGLDDKPADTERGGFTPLYIGVGEYVTDETGSKRLED
jgi:hypothetical protein